MAKTGKVAAVAGNTKDVANTTAGGADIANAAFKVDVTATATAAFNDNDTEFRAEGGAALDTTSDATIRADLVLLQTYLTSKPTTAGIAASLTAVTGAIAMLDFSNGTAATAAGKMTQYSEVNAAASASVATDMGWTITMGASLDVGNGYDFADDDGFDGRTVGAVSLDTISIDFGAGGVLSLNDNGFAHLVDADDDAAADLLYTNTFGTASFSVAADIDDGDSDHKVTAASFTFASGAADTDLDGVAGYTAASAAADVQWSAKVSMPLAGTNVYFAADEAGGDAYGVSGTYAGIGWSVDSKREALAKDTGAKRSNTVKVSYATGALTLGASYDSIKDGDQWGVSAAYAAGALSLNVSTDEGDDWSASGAYDLGNGASLVGGTNYTEDAYVGVSFAF
jgi:hypothetical protein